MEYIKSVTPRGFELLQFKDDYNEVCDIQRSSSACSDNIWVGIHNPHPQILASTVKLGATGWIDYEMPKDTIITHRMHLTRNQSISLAFKLLKFGLFNKVQ